MIGSRIKELRRRSKQSRAQLSESLGIAERSLIAYEQETRNVPSELLPLLAKHFHVTSDYLLGISDDLSPIGIERKEHLQEGFKNDIVDTGPFPETIAAHTDGPMTPELKAEIEDIARQVMEKYLKNRR